MGVGKEGSLPGKAIQTGGLKGGVGIEAGNIPPAHIVGENVDQIWSVHETALLCKNSDKSY